VVTALLFLGALFLSPLVRTIGGGVAAGEATLYPVVAPALILIGTMIIGGLREVDWSDPSEAIPAFLTVVMMPLTLSITEGVAFGVVAYVLLKAASGRIRQLHPLLLVFAALFVLRYAWLR
jgi:adenine/guanine/hypoxanthine permease